MNNSNSNNWGTKIQTMDGDRERKPEIVAFLVSFRICSSSPITSRIESSRLGLEQAIRAQIGWVIPIVSYKEDFVLGCIVVQ